jgi:hypothetical protein
MSPDPFELFSKRQLSLVRRPFVSYEFATERQRSADGTPVRWTELFGICSIPIYKCESNRVFDSENHY